MTLFPDPRIIKEYMDIWERFLDSMASEGGHIVLWVCGIIFGTGVVYIGFDVLGDRIIAGAITGLGIALKTTHSNYQRRSGSEVVVSETTTPAKPEGETK